MIWCLTFLEHFDCPLPILHVYKFDVQPYGHSNDCTCKFSNTCRTVTIVTGINVQNGARAIWCKPKHGKNRHSTLELTVPSSFPQIWCPNVHGFSGLHWIRDQDMAYDVSFWDLQRVRLISHHSQCHWKVRFDFSWPFPLLIRSGARFPNSLPSRNILQFRSRITY